MFHVKHLGVAEFADDVLARLHAFERLLVERAVPLGLLSDRDRCRVWERHVLDSTRAARCIGDTVRSVVDVGSGAGLPGIPLAIIQPEITVTLVEAARRRAAFLELAVERLVLRNVTVVPRRAQDAAIRAEVAVARAVADPAQSWELAKPLLEAGGYLVYFAGRSWGEGRDAGRLGPGVVATICDPAPLDDGGPLVMIRGVVDEGTQMEPRNG